MWHEKVILLIFLVSAVMYSSVCAFRKCDIRDGFDVDNLQGNWHFIARIDEKRDKVRCGHLYLRRKSEHVFRGTLSGIYGKKGLRSVSIFAYYRNGIFAFRDESRKDLDEEILMKIKTCNDQNEFSLELPKNQMYWIFGKDKKVTPIFLKKYRKLGRSIGSKLMRLDNTDCPEYHDK